MNGEEGGPQWNDSKNAWHLLEYSLHEYAHFPLMKSLDRGHRHPKLEVPRRTCLGRE
jgi:hypothetical protein